MMSQNKLTLSEVTKKGKSGQIDDVDFFMQNLHKESSIAHCKLIDYGLSLVKTDNGKKQIEHYLFHGTSIQQCYSALYFKRIGEKNLLRQAFELKCIDEDQAFSR